MFPLAHVYVGSRVVGGNDPWVVLGSVVVDIAEISFGRVGRKLVEDPFGFGRWVEKQMPELRPMALGVMAHSEGSKGLDYYSDDLENGFAIKEGKRLKAEIERRLPEVKEKAIFGHSLFEVGVDISLAVDDWELVRAYGRGVVAADKDLAARAIADFGEEDLGEVKREIGKLLMIFGQTNYWLARLMARSGGWRVVGKMMGWWSVGRGIEMMERLREETRGRYRNYLDESVVKIRRNLKGWL